MSRTWEIPAYVALAREAAAVMGAANDATARAILAQWQCEQPAPAPWPPIHNNPGNLTRYVGTLDREPHTIATGAPGAGLLYVYGSPDTGARAYGNYLLYSTRYAGARAAARAGNAVAFLTDVCNAGYGTRLTCVLALLPAVSLGSALPSPARWQCFATRVNVRTAPNTAATITGAVTSGQVVTGTLVSGGPYAALGGTHNVWLQLGPGRYTAAAFYRATT